MPPIFTRPPNLSLGPLSCPLDQPSCRKESGLSIPAFCPNTDSLGPRTGSECPTLRPRRPCTHPVYFQTPCASGSAQARRVPTQCREAPPRSSPTPFQTSPKRIRGALGARFPEAPDAMGESTESAERSPGPSPSGAGDRGAAGTEGQGVAEPGSGASAPRLHAPLPGERSRPLPSGPGPQPRPAPSRWPRPLPVAPPLPCWDSFGRSGVQRKLGAV